MRDFVIAWGALYLTPGILLAAASDRHLSRRRARVGRRPAPTLVRVGAAGWFAVSWPWQLWRAR